ncbi:MAG: energy transducer TonB [Saprospiraceae bacterium]|nr:energy transducer TonB [Saprospiraceae bacterium]
MLQHSWSHSDHSVNTSVMAAEMHSGPAYRDMLDIVFSNRNRAYGAYLLRREYPNRLRNALIFALILVGIGLGAPLLLRAAKTLMPLDPYTEYKPILEAPPIELEKVPPPPVVETPPPPTRSTIEFVPPVVRPDELVNEAPQTAVDELVQSTADIGATTQTGTDEAPPAIIENPTELRIIEEPKKPAEEETFEIFTVQKPPSFPGGENELMLYLAKNIKYPALANENRIQGAVHLSFVVNKDGTVSDVTIVRDIGGGCGKEAVRVVSNMPKWSPGEANGHPVKVRYRLPVRFKLQ